MIIEKIAELKKQRNAVILAHYYTTPEVQQVADFVGDSLALAQQAASTSADVILFAGVTFMAETAKILNPTKIVLLPDMEAGCSLADSCRAADFKRFIEANPGHTVISYVNTTAEVKALTDIVCTSSNAVQIVESLPREAKIIFGPDRNLGSYIKAITGRSEMKIWDGACHVHQRFSLDRILKLKAQNPGAKILAHPECPRPVVLVADMVGSTAQMLNFSQTDLARTYIVATESGILFQMQQASPAKHFIAAPGEDMTCACNDCAYMKLNTLVKIEHSLRTLQGQIELPSDIMARAKVPIERMLALSK